MNVLRTGVSRSVFTRNGLIALEGHVGVQVGDEVSEAGPGELVFKPRAVPHEFWNAGDEPARLLELISPAGFERFFEEAAPHISGEGRPDFEALAQARERYGLRMDFESAAGLSQR